MLTRDATAPPYEALRPLKAPTSETFPVHPDLADALVDAKAHPDDVVAHALAVFAGYAYADEATVAMMMARMGLAGNHCRMIGQYVDAMFISSTAFLVQSEDGRVVVLAYRGTRPFDFVAWLTDADVYPERVPFAFGPSAGGPFEVHAGFYRNVRCTRHEVVAALERARRGRSVHHDGRAMPNEMEALYITGHSLGAAMAALMATMLVTDARYSPLVERLRAVYTFGQPMIGSPAFARACDAHHFLGHDVIRYVYRRDVVPSLPPDASGPFAHFGPEHRFDKDWPWTPSGHVTQQMGHLIGLVETPLAFVGRRIRVLRDLPFRYSIDDHGPQHYISSLAPPGVRSEFGD